MPRKFFSGILCVFLAIVFVGNLWADDESTCPIMRFDPDTWTRFMIEYATAPRVHIDANIKFRLSLAQAFNYGTSMGLLGATSTMTQINGTRDLAAIAGHGQELDLWKSHTMSRMVFLTGFQCSLSIHAEIRETGVCDPDAGFVLTSITSDEPDDGLGDGDMENDIQGAEFGTPDTTFMLRAERSGTGEGRTYIIVYTAYDSCNTEPNNTATVTVYVQVPQSKSKK